MIDPHKPKYHELYWSWAEDAAKESPARRHKVGAIIITRTGMISPGWNGMPSGLGNECENWKHIPEEDKYRWKTKPEVIHAERNAIDKMTRQGQSTEGAILFVTRAPCFECSKSLVGLGFKTIYFDYPHDDMSGVELMVRAGVDVRARYTRDMPWNIRTMISNASGETPSVASKSFETHHSKDGVPHQRIRLKD